MPFKESYAVNLGNGNRHPYLNPNGWPDLELSPPTPDDLAERFPDSSGLGLGITRGLSAAPNTLAMNAVYVVPPGGISLDTRVLLRATFDLPRAEGLPVGDHGPLGGSVDLGASRTPGDRGAPATEVERPGLLSPGTPVPPGVELSVPEPWAVALIVSPGNDLRSAGAVIVTCQFNRQPPGGVRLNTPKDPQGFGGLQADKAAYLESPLDYDRYQGGYIALPGGADGVVPPPIFTLEHSFCGWSFAQNGHTPGCGGLSIRRTWRPDVPQDHRVYSNNALTHAAVPATRIGALGVTLATQNGVGRMRVRLRSFELWFNPGT